MNATEIVGYIFNADIYCPRDTLAAVKATYPLDYPLSATVQAMDTPEDILRTVAKSLNLAGAGIDLADESTYDSDEFPKVVFASDATELDVCGACGEPLV